MSKLFKLKQWHTLEDAAKHLTAMLGEPVSEADICRLALDGHLILSVNFVNHASVRKGPIVGRDQAIVKVRKNPAKGELLHISYMPEGFEYQVIESVSLGEDRYVNLEKEIISISGVWDLLMLAGERLDVEHLYQSLINGPEVTLTNLEGAFVQRDGFVAQIMESFNENEFTKGSTASLEEMEKVWAIKNTPEDKRQAMLLQHKEDRKKYIEKRNSEPRENDYYPAAGLPSDSVLVVRTSAIMDFLSSLNEMSPLSEKPLSTKERQTLLVLIGALCKQNEMDWNGRGVSVAIVKATEEVGAPITDDTVLKVLKQINGALESRSK